jgi:hypothetical protein
MGEESDENPDPQSDNDKYISHYELYLRAMRDIGASTNDIESFVDKIKQGDPLNYALQQTIVPDYTKRFVTDTIKILSMPSHLVAAYFQFGREDPIPEMFKSILSTLEKNPKSNGNLHNFKQYLQRHIQLDGEEHGPAGLKLVLSLTKSQRDMDEIVEYAQKAIESRIRLWDGILLDIQKQKDL